jgi:hypothetical protein
MNDLVERERKGRRERNWADGGYKKVGDYTNWGAVDWVDDRGHVWL